MSYNDHDIILDAGYISESGTDVELASAQLREYFTKRNALNLWLLAEDWLNDHNAEAEDIPEYVKGVYRGIIIAARELDGMR